ncbi:MAG: hypothetical protein QNJ14_06440 [Woeseiaceae bacterium]|nr:hypothetical protein [Woeseiaceae bacterium]
MNTELDPHLQALFARAEQPIDGDRFLSDIMSRIDRHRQRVLLGWSLAGLVALSAFVFVAGPVFAAVDLVSRFLPVSLVEVESELLQMLLSSVNSVAAAAALGGLLIAKFFRWIFR